MICVRRVLVCPLLVILWFRRSEMYAGNLEVCRPIHVGRSRVSLMALGAALFGLLSPGYPFKRRMSSNMFWCFMDVVCVEHLSSIRFRSLRMKLIFDFLGMADWWCSNSGFLAVFCKTRRSFCRLWS